jgi:uncharacterized protein (DUF2141 family)
MKYTIAFIVGFWSLTSFTLLSSGNKLTVKTNGYSSNEGKAYVALFRPTDDFPKVSGQYKAKVIEITNKTASVTFENVPNGTYAVAVFHDKNKNGILDKNLVGAPTEDYGFSNNARETFSAPSFKSASFEVDKDRVIAIYVK